MGQRIRGAGRSPIALRARQDWRIGHSLLSEVEPCPCPTTRERARSCQIQRGQSRRHQSFHQMAVDVNQLRLPIELSVERLAPRPCLRPPQLDLQLPQPKTGYSASRLVQIRPPFVLCPCFYCIVHESVARSRCHWCLREQLTPDDGHQPALRAEVVACTQDKFHLDAGEAIR